MPIRKTFSLVAFPLMALVITVGAASMALGQEPNADLFSHARMQEVDLKGLRVWLGQPVQVTAQIGWKMSWPQVKETYSFIHLTPFLAKFPSGQLIGIYTLDPDTQANPVFASGFQISKDGGAHWGRRYSMIMQHISVFFVPKPDNALLAVPSEMFEKTAGDEQNLQGPYYLFEHGGDRMVFVPDGEHVVGLPWPVEVHTGTQPRENWHATLHMTSYPLELGGKLLASGYCQKKGEKVYNSLLFASDDGGYTWRYQSTIAGPDPSLVGQRSYEGPDESSLIRLADGDLMAVFRVGSGRKWNLGRAYSHDGGHTWSQPDSLPAWSVEPELVRTANGTIALSTGRPGINLWLSTDGRGTGWQSIDIVDHHNRTINDPTARISPFEGGPTPYLSENARWQTSSYTGLVEVAPNRLLLMYDRDPERAPADDNDLSRVFVLPIEIERE